MVNAQVLRKREGSIMKDELFPQIKRSIENYLTEEEGNISRSKLLKIGSMVLLMGVLFMQDSFAAHGSHNSHSSHSSGGGDHVSHISHTSHSSGFDGYSSPSHSSGSGGTVNSPASPSSAASNPMPSVPTPHVPPQNNFETSVTPPQQPDLNIPGTPAFTATMISSETNTTGSNN